MKQTRHRTRAMLDRYVRDGSLFRDNAGGGLGL
ncbi:MAG: integrase, partial [Candidatus Sericytochromatia bacterium]|nr:integrase [Candidatus Sericytochromatia bacterium]